MKSIIKIFAAFIFFIFALCINTQSEAHSTNITNYIQNNSQKVVLLSENLHNSEISSQINNTNNSIYKPNNIVTSSFFDSLYKNSISCKEQENIHNLSTYFFKEINIRAP